MSSITTGLKGVTLAVIATEIHTVVEMDTAGEETIVSVEAVTMVRTPMMTDGVDMRTGLAVMMTGGDSVIEMVMDVMVMEVAETATVVVTVA